MAVDFKVEHSRTSEYLMRPRDITIRPELNGRHEHTDVADLIDSFVAVGQLTPVDIGSDGGKPYLVFGHRRWRAAVEGIKSGKLPKDFKLRCVYFKGTPLDELKAVIAENIERKSTTAMCEAQNIAKLERYNMTHEEIAAFYSQRHVDGSPDVGWVKKRLALISLTPESQEAVKNKRVKPSAVQMLAKLSREQQAEACRSESVTPATVKAVVSGAVNGHARVNKNEALRAIIRSTAEGNIPLDISNFDRGMAVIKFAQYLLNGDHK
jgi:ParB-like chromosome segregation protein Spo0J